MMASSHDDDWGDLAEDHEPLSDTGWDDMDTQDDDDSRGIARLIVLFPSQSLQAILCLALMHDRLAHIG